MDQHQIITQLEEHAENIIKKTRKYLPHIGRFCLISTFVEDGIRMINQWGEQRDYIGKSNLTHFLTTVGYDSPVISYFQVVP